jgi:hypothetical protein
VNLTRQGDKVGHQGDWAGGNLQGRDLERRELWRKQAPEVYSWALSCTGIGWSTAAASGSELTPPEVTELPVVLSWPPQRSQSCLWFWADPPEVTQLPVVLSWPLSGHTSACGSELTTPEVIQLVRKRSLDTQHIQNRLLKGHPRTRFLETHSKKLKNKPEKDPEIPQITFLPAWKECIFFEGR